ncbi:metalloprotease PmbA [Niveibacterium umoris]|uniref:PmbA protein n=1 Tax=Niveibacterium umoris TaxID=1193620 RepID=A0A840BUX7_9RHOO|nr:metalloprotease PmbA [Niveibacterium umoris]MBB4014606.1 PmbA protein [Niveibacterium umoris]
MATGTGFSFTQDSLREIAADVLRHATTQGASACSVDVSEGWGHSVTVRQGDVDTLEYHRDKGVSVTVYLGQQRGHASTTDFAPQALRDTVAAAVSIARFTASDPAAGLPDADQLAREPRELGLFHPWATDVDTSIDMARRCEEAGFAVSDQVSNSEGASVSTQQSQFVSANSLGFCEGFATTRHGFGCSMIAGEGDGMQRDDWFVTKRDAATLPAPEAVGAYAARRALSRLNARKLSTCEVPVLFEAPLAASLIGHFVTAASGGSLYRRSSFLLDALGEKVFSDVVTLLEDPFIPGGMASGWFDDEGVATARREVVSRGTLNGWFLGSYSARKLGLKSTGNAGGCHNLILQPGKLDLNGLLKKMGRGLFVTELLGHGVNNVTGDYSRGAAGYWVENGEIAYPVHEITIAGNLREMYADIVACGNDMLTRGSKHCGSVLIGNMTVAGD